jgi:branched-chain amino acid transport system permease protein
LRSENDLSRVSEWLKHASAIAVSFMHEFIIFTIAGLATAGIFAITAAGLTLTYATTGIFNWSHGAIGMMAAFAYWQMRVGWGWPAMVSFVVCLFVLAPGLGIVLEAGVMRRLEGTSEATKLVVTLALALSMVGIAQWIWNPLTYRALPPLFAGETLVIGPIRISYNDLTILIIALAVAIGLRLVLYKTRLGVTMRASVDDRTLTTLNGASSVKSARSAWIIGCVLAALAGILVAPTLTLSASALTLLIVDAYAASVIGRLKSIPMTFVGSIILGLSVSYSVAYLPQNPYIQGFEGAVPAVILFVALLLLPQSRLRGHRALRSRELAQMPTWRGTVVFIVCLITAATMLATVVSQSDLYSLNRVWGLAIIGLSLVPVVGFAGRLSLCQMTFAGIGAVVFGHLGANGDPLALLAAAAVCAAVGVVVALPALRLSGIYFALSTAAFAVAMDAWVFPLPAFSLLGRQFAPFGEGSLSFPPFRVGGIVLSNEEVKFVVGSAAFALLGAVVVLLRRSKFGHRLLAFKDSPAACATLGMNARASTLAVFALSAGIAGIGGALYGQALGSAAPDVYEFFAGLSVLLVMVVVGINSWGAGAVCGIFLGGPTLANFFPSLTQLSSVLVGGSGVSVGTTPNGLIPSGLRPLWTSVVRRRPLLLGILVGVVGVWGLRLGGILDNWEMTVILGLTIAGASSIPYTIDYKRGSAPSAFGLPARIPPTDAEGGSAASLPPLPDLAQLSRTMSPPIGAKSHGA